MTLEMTLDPEPVEEALRAEVASLERIAPAAWTISLPAYTPIPCRAEFAEGWLSVQTETLAAPTTGRLRRASPEDWLWTLLRQPEASGGARPVLAGRDRVLVRADALLPGLEGLDARVRTLLRGVKTVFLSASDKGKGPELPEDLSEDASACLAARCAETGWEFSRRSDGRVMVTLDAGDLFRQAALRPLEGGGVRAHVELAMLPAKAPAAQTHALARLLLRAAGQIRAVAGAAWGGEGGTAVGLEAVLETPPAATELAHALAALSLGCRLCGREAEALGDPRISAEYLALQRGFAG